MPPLPAWFAGAGPVTRFLASHVLTGPGQFIATPVVANGQTALASYRREPDGSYLAHAIQVLSTARGRVSRIVIFLDPGLFTTFGLSPALHAATAPAPLARGEANSSTLAEAGW
jgi:RNA polymerase sigma-70 factor (ECF subfamily)